jgi:hypothetical protein
MIGSGTSSSDRLVAKPRRSMPAMPLYTAFLRSGLISRRERLSILIGFFPLDAVNTQPSVGEPTLLRWSSSNRCSLGMMGIGALRALVFGSFSVPHQSFRWMWRSSPLEVLPAECFQLALIYAGPRGNRDGQANLRAVDYLSGTAG